MGWKAGAVTGTLLVWRAEGSPFVGHALKKASENTVYIYLGAYLETGESGFAHNPQKMEVETGKSSV